MEQGALRGGPGSAGGFNSCYFNSLQVLIHRGFKSDGRFVY